MRAFSHSIPCASFLHFIYASPTARIWCKHLRELLCHLHRVLILRLTYLPAVKHLLYHLLRIAAEIVSELHKLH